MGFLYRDKSDFTHFPARYEQDGRGDGRNVYDTPGERFGGHLQPASESGNTEAYGIDMRYDYAIYTAETPETLKETDRVQSGKRTFEVRALRRFKSYDRLLIKELIERE